MSYLQTAALDTNVAIETPEHIVFHYRIAGPARRAVAYGIDLVLCYGTVALLTVLVLFVAVGTAFETADLDSFAKGAFGLVLLALFAAQWIYFVAWEGRSGRTPGKRALGLQVTTASGRPIGWRAAALRNLLRAADFLPTAYVVGLVSMTLSSRFQRLGDIVAGTMVVVPERANAASALVLSPPARPEELSDLPDHVLLDESERSAIELFLRRKNKLGPARTAELAEMIAPQIGARLGYAHDDPARLLEILYDRAMNSGRQEARADSWHPLRLGRKRGAR
jgi:uncharacterized RDD family membrane protein YckC